MSVVCLNIRIYFYSKDYVVWKIKIIKQPAIRRHVSPVYENNLFVTLKQQLGATRAYTIISLNADRAVF